jgi:nitrite reductase/ring-hydroxylating ferredoxin subunit/uncharacterized membrane protein
MDGEAIANAIDQQEWLDAIADPLQTWIKESLQAAGIGVKDALHGVWLGHPLHPVLTDIPVGAWTVALVLDALEGLGGRKEMAAGADVAVAIGLAGAVGSAITGLADWSETDFRAKKVGVTHGLLNIAATALYSASMIMRGRKRLRQKAVALSMLGYAISGVSAYLGGHLVMGEQVGVDHTATADQGKPEEYRPVLDAGALPEKKPTRVLADGVAVLLVKRGEEILAISETCPHLGGPLSEGKLVGDAIECPWHGSRLSLEDGSVVCGPTTYPARCFDARIRNGQVEVKARKS